MLVESFDRKNNIYIGRSENDAPFVDGVIKILGGNCKLGQFYKVKILNAHEYDLEGQLIN